MSQRISDFFWEDLIEEQHIWTIDQIAGFYQTTQEEVISALAKANDKYKEDPRSVNHRDPDSDDNGRDEDAVLRELYGDVQCIAGESGIESSA